MELNLTQWVSETEDYVDIRRAMHIVLTAVSSSSRLSSIMALKGGVLMAIQYANTRFTTDLDFSALSNPQEVDIEALRSELNNSLLAAEVELNTYNLACRVQKIKKQPKDFETVDFPSLLITIGYAKKDNVGAMKRLEKGESPLYCKQDIFIFYIQWLIFLLIGNTMKNTMLRKGLTIF